MNATLVREKMALLRQDDIISRKLSREVGKVILYSSTVYRLTKKMHLTLTSFQMAAN